MQRAADGRGRGQHPQERPRVFATTFVDLPLSQVIWEASWVDALEDTPFCKVEESTNP